MILPEPNVLAIMITNALGLLILMVLYFFGVWSRSYIFPAETQLPLKRQLVAAVPVGFITMGLYAKSALPTINLEQGGVFDFAIMLGYAIFLGMISRETLDKLLTTAKTGSGAVAPVGVSASSDR